MTIISGLRRVGKTTLIFQLIDWLHKQKQVPSYQIFYYSFDESRYHLEEILTFYQMNILKKELSAFEHVYFFFDEIQKLSNWRDQIKIIYDLHPNIKITLSGSANIIMKAGSRESLAGRFFDYDILPLDFPEYLHFKEVVIDSGQEGIFQQTIAREFEQFLKTGGFIEAIPFDDIHLVKYFKESILERVTYRDIPDVFSITAPDLLLRLLHILAQRPGLYLEYKNIANDLKFDQRTVTNYFDYLEYSFLTKRLYNFSTNRLTSEKKLKRAYLSNTGFTYALMGELNLPALMEQFWINFLQADYFFRSPQKDEVDIVLENGGKVIPVEIKLRESIYPKTINPLLKFLRRFNLEHGLVISSQTETDIVRNGKAITIIPYWKYWSILKWLEENQQ